MGAFLSRGKVRGSCFLEWVGGPREARSWPSKSWRRELSMEPTLVKAAAAGGGGRRPAFTRVWSIDDNRRPNSGADCTPASGLVFRPILRAEGKGCRPLPTARGRARPSRRRGYALLVWIFEGF